jgi:hypothetical protein
VSAPVSGRNGELEGIDVQPVARTRYITTKWPAGGLAAFALAMDDTPLDVTSKE